MTATIWVEISLASHGLSGAEAFEIRNALEEQIENAGIGEVVGGGCATDGAACDLEVSSDDLDAAEKGLRDLLSHAGLLDATAIRRE